MSDTPSPQPPLFKFLGLDPEKSQKYAGWLKFEAILFIVLGVLAIMLPGLFSVGLSLFLGWLFLIGGIFSVIGALQAMKAKNFIWRLASGILTAVVGALVISKPLEWMAILTLIVAGYFLIDGIFKIIYGLRAMGVPGAGMAIINGIFGLIIAWIVYAQWPVSAEWFLGMLIGINLLMAGLFLLRVSGGIKKHTSNP
ncbi:HdeD family acid-resistance protein [Ruficoccus sp. ZRK36]|uniref:HdeD family acid-resistance protein n=1 Tax=Ruficoccus sp. ZRK36 TaxID=2866311 RepID=UPI001C7349A3|nr:HdeD family acid-resistance protein [Ruficoccus sp. ZRK36]QYY34930.1 HdeD family acid-resistance protein [Ruficoccus sp. ZRK36]